MNLQPPSNLSSLQRRIFNRAREQGVLFSQLQRVVANAVLCQMLPPSVVKGGVALAMRLGDRGSRFTEDVDVVGAQSMSAEEYFDSLSENLAHGWIGFTGAVEGLPAATVIGAAHGLSVHRVRIRLAYAGRHWLSIPFEFSNEENQDVVDADRRIYAGIVDTFRHLGLEEPMPVALLSIDRQVAEKLHVCTTASGDGHPNDRAHDLVDLQLILADSAVSLPSIRAMCVRLFSARSQHQWPPTVSEGARWAQLYERAAHGLPVLPTVHSAVAWANELITDIERAS